MLVFNTEEDTREPRLKDAGKSVYGGFRECARVRMGAEFAIRAGKGGG